MVVLVCLRSCWGSGSASVPHDLQAAAARTKEDVSGGGWKLIWTCFNGQSWTCWRLFWMSSTCRRIPGLLADSQTAAILILMISDICSNLMFVFMLPVRNTPLYTSDMGGVPIIILKSSTFNIHISKYREKSTGFYTCHDFISSCLLLFFPYN